VLRAKARQTGALIGLAMLATFMGCAPINHGGGWMLLVPPLAADGSADENVPLAQWQLVYSYSTQTDCEAALERTRFDAHRWFGPIGRALSWDEQWAVQILRARCVVQQRA
jgi:hypothetical protein